MNAAQRRTFRRAHALVPGAEVKRIPEGKKEATFARVVSVDPGKHAVIVKRKDNRTASWSIPEIMRAMHLSGSRAVSA